MNLLIYHVVFEQQIRITNAKFLPRVGDRIDMFHEPFPTVDVVILFPSLALQKKLNVSDIDAIIYVK